MIDTVGDLITFALRASWVNGVGQTPLAEDMNDSLVLLRSLIGNWQRKRWLVPNLVTTSLVSTGAQTYSIGSGQNFDVARPDKIESAYFRIINTVAPAGGVDMPLQIIQAREDYNRIALKSLVTIPTTLFYDSAWPTGTLYFWPIPPANLYRLFVTTKSTLPDYLTMTTPINLPPEYEQALIYNLAVRIAMNYGLAANPGHVALAKEGMDTIRVANAQIATLKMPGDIMRRGTGGIAAGSDPGFQSGWSV